MRVLIVGCGYVGLPLGAELAGQGHEVFGLRRARAAEAELKAAGVRLLTADITAMADLQKLPGPFDWVVGQTDGSWVDERSPTEPASDTSRILLETEEVLRAAARSADFSPIPSPLPKVAEKRTKVRAPLLTPRRSPPRCDEATARRVGSGTEVGAPLLKNLPAVILRVAGIYGPGRGYWFQQYLRGEATMPEGGKRILNMIHRDDLAGIIIAALKQGQPGEIYNAVDDEPVAQIDFFRWLSQTLRREMPPFAAATQEPARKRGFTEKRVSNEKLRTQLGYAFKYPTFRQGFAAAALPHPK